MKYAVRMLAGFYILISVFSFFSLGGCIRVDHREVSRGDRHYYRDGRWYRHDSRGSEISVADLVIGAFVVSLPPQHRTVVVQNTQYYHDGNHYYRPAPSGGYMVVAQPVIVQPRAQSKHDERGEKGGKYKK